MKKILYIFPHYDDEIFVIPKLKHDIKNGHDVKIVFLMDSEKRLQESTFFLKNILGINEKNISVLNIHRVLIDSEIFKFTWEIYEEIYKNYKNLSEIVTTAYEGGHQDHDAASIVGRALAHDFQITLYEFFLYNGHKTIGKLYRVASPFHCTNKHRIKYTFRDLIELSKVPFVYKTQWSTMIGLWPFLYLKAFFLPLVLRPLSGEALKLGELTEVPMYERWKRTTYADFNQAARLGVNKCKSITYLFS